MIRRPPRSTLSSSSAASDVYKRQLGICVAVGLGGGDVLHGGAHAPLCLHQQLEVVRAGGDAHGVLEGHPASLDVAEQRLVEGLHAVVAAGGDDLLSLI